MNIERNSVKTKRFMRASLETKLAQQPHRERTEVEMQEQRSARKQFGSPQQTQK